MSVIFHTSVLRAPRGMVRPAQSNNKQRVSTMNSSFLQRVHVAMLLLACVWAAICFAAWPVVDGGIFAAIALGPLVSYGIVAWLIWQLRR